MEAHFFQKIPSVVFASSRSLSKLCVASDGKRVLSVNNEVPYSATGFMTTSSRVVAELCEVWCMLTLLSSE